MYTNLRQQLNKEAKIKTSDDNDEKEEEVFELNCINEDDEIQDVVAGKESKLQKIHIQSSLNTIIQSNTPKPKMQRKYNMALQHFYQAATHSATEDDDIKTRLRNLSGSEEDLYMSEKEKEQCYEMANTVSDYNENAYFAFKKEMSIKQLKPNGMCSLRNCAICWIWFILFLLGVSSLTYFLQYTIRKIEPSHLRETSQNPVVYGHMNETKNEIKKSLLQTCTDFNIEKVWHKTYEKFQTESSIRLVDVNEDGHDDLIMGFVTSLDGYGKVGERKELCTKYYNGKFPCFGGVLATNGVTGEELWTHYSWHDIFAVNCNGDLNNDGVADCLCAGRGGVSEAISGKDGKLLWMFLDSKNRNEMMNLYTPQFVNDIDRDGVMDIIQIHGGDPQAEPFSEKRLTAKILVISGKTGLVLKSHEMPDNNEAYFSPVVYNFKNGSDVVIYGTGGETHKGSLYAILLEDLYSGDITSSREILSDDTKGYMNPPILVDVNKDGVVDLVNAGYSSKIQVIDGETFKVLWTYSISSTETYSIPAVGYYNDDDVVDFFIRLNTGPGFPVYYNSKVIILDGSTGKPITKEYMTASPAHSSPLSVSMEGSGNDLFLHWSADCEGHEHQGGAYKFVHGTNIHESSRTDSCIARFDTKSFSKLYVTNKNFGLPGKEIYYSGDYAKLEHGETGESEQRKRHIGVPDHGGVQRLLQTGAVLPSLDVDRKQLSDSFDVVFATYYIQPPTVRVIRPSDMKCIREYRKKAKNGEADNKIDIDENLKQGIYDEGDTATNYCLAKRMNETKFDNQESATKKNFNHGKLTLYRFKVTCKCSQENNCSKVLPQEEQGWTGYMGTLANGYFNHRQHGRFQRED